MGSDFATVKKLLALAERSKGQEARNAALGACRRLAKHFDLTAEELVRDEVPEIVDRPSTEGSPTMGPSSAPSPLRMLRWRSRQPGEGPYACDLHYQGCWSEAEFVLASEDGAIMAGRVCGAHLPRIGPSAGKKRMPMPPEVMGLAREASKAAGEALETASKAAGEAFGKTAANGAINALRRLAKR